MQRCNILRIAELFAVARRKRASQDKLWLMRSLPSLGHIFSRLAGSFIRAVSIAAVVQSCCDHTHTAPKLSEPSQRLLRRIRLDIDIDFTLKGQNMHFDRRIILQGTAAIPLAVAMPRWATASGAFNLQPGSWRTFQVVTRLEIADPEGRTQAWVPVPAVDEASGSSRWAPRGSVMAKPVSCAIRSMDRSLFTSNGRTAKQSRPLKSSQNFDTRSRD